MNYYLKLINIWVYAGPLLPACSGTCMLEHHILKFLSHNVSVCKV